MNILAVIPARYDASRFPGKPLAAMAGKSLLERVYLQACQAREPRRVVVATDDERIRAHAASFGAEVMMTETGHPTGTDRLGEVALALPGYDAVLNVQGDMPFVDPAQIDQLCDLITGPTRPAIASLMTPITTTAALENPNVVKVVTDLEDKALYFSRSPVPYLRGEPGDLWVNQHTYYKHIGLYAYRAPLVATLTALPPSRLERAEGLEQLRWLEAGYALQMGRTEADSPSIDTPEDLEAALVQRGLKAPGED
jgi:3-deoxy-manno-octulosonate cytidylyltransferase (CMP-KDO synthetase)